MQRVIDATGSADTFTKMPPGPCESLLDSLTTSAWAEEFCLPLTCLLWCSGNRPRLSGTEEEVRPVLWYHGGRKRPAQSQQGVSTQPVDRSHQCMRCNAWVCERLTDCDVRCASLCERLWPLWPLWALHCAGNVASRWANASWERRKEIVAEHTYVKCHPPTSSAHKSALVSHHTDGKRHMHARGQVFRDGYVLLSGERSKGPCIHPSELSEVWAVQR
jgi:hypothetical protein